MLSKVLEKAVSILPGSKYRRWILLELPHRTMKSLPKADPALAFRELSSDELDVLSKVNPSVDGSHLRERYVSGNRCFLSELDGIPVFYQWVFLNRESVNVHLNTRTNMHVDLVLPPRWAYRWDAWTSEPYRGRGIQPSATRRVCGQLLEEGCRGLVTLVNANNRPSLRAFMKNDFSSRCALSHLRLFGHDLLLGQHETIDDLSMGTG